MTTHQSIKIDHTLDRFGRSQQLREQGRPLAQTCPPVDEEFNGQLPQACENNPVCQVEYVDGGYYENHGLETLLEFIKNTPEDAVPLQGWKIIILGNGRSTELTELYHEVSTQSYPIAEIYLPLLGLYQTRSGRALANIRAEEFDNALEVIVEASLWDGVSLGWTTTETGREKMGRASVQAARQIQSFIQR